jgi:hypothetical protein
MGGISGWKRRGERAGTYGTLARAVVEAARNDHVQGVNDDVHAEEANRYVHFRVARDCPGVRVLVEESGREEAVHRLSDLTRQQSVSCSMQTRAKHLPAHEGVRKAGIEERGQVLAVLEYRDRERDVPAVHEHRLRGEFDEPRVPDHRELGRARDLRHVGHDGTQPNAARGCVVAREKEREERRGHLIREVLKERLGLGVDRVFVITIASVPDRSGDFGGVREIWRRT